MSGTPTPGNDPDAKSVLDGLYQERKTLSDEIEPLIAERRKARVEFETRGKDEDETKRPSQEERDQFAADEEAFNERVASKISELRSVNQRIEQEETVATSLEIAQRASSRSPSVQITDQPLTYNEHNQYEQSYMLDLAYKMVPEARQHSIPKAEGYEERLAQHAKEWADMLPKREQNRRRLAERQIEDAELAFRSRAKKAGLKVPGWFESSPFERAAASVLESRAPSRIVGQGGYGIPPLWLVQDYIPALRPGRVVANLPRQMVLPQGTDSINIPRLLTPTLTGVQGADAGPVVSRDFSDTFQQANVKTIAGQEDVPIQLIEQSPGQILDRVLMTDLQADYDKQLDLQVLVGNGTGAPLSGGQIVGLYPAANWGATTLSWAGGSPAAPVEFGQVLGAMASKTAYNRFNLQQFAYAMHPRRWFWFATGLDATTTGRYIVNSDNSDFSHFNVEAIENDPTPFEGYAGRVPFGPKAYIDANVPITDNGSGAAGGSNDVAVGAIWDDCWLFEGDLRTRVLSEVLSGTLELRFQVYGYVAFLVRYGVSVALCYGTAFSQPYTLSGSSNGVAF